MAGFRPQWPGCTTTAGQYPWTKREHWMAHVAGVANGADALLAAETENRRVPDEDAEEISGGRLGYRLDEADSGGTMRTTEIQESLGQLMARSPQGRGAGREQRRPSLGPLRLEEFRGSRVSGEYKRWQKSSNALTAHYTDLRPESKVC